MKNSVGLQFLLHTGEKRDIALPPMIIQWSKTYPYPEPLKPLLNLNFHQDYTRAWMCDITVELLWSVWAIFFWAIFILPFMAVTQAITTDFQARDTRSKAKIAALANRNQGGMSLKTTSAHDNISSYFITFYGTLTLSSFWVISKLNSFSKHK